MHCRCIDILSFCRQSPQRRLAERIRLDAARHWRESGLALRRGGLELIRVAAYTLLLQYLFSLQHYLHRSTTCTDRPCFDGRNGNGGKAWGSCLGLRAAIARLDTRASAQRLEEVRARTWFRSDWHRQGERCAYARLQINVAGLLFEPAGDLVVHRNSK